MGPWKLWIPVLAWILQCDDQASLETTRQRERERARSRSGCSPWWWLSSLRQPPLAERAGQARAHGICYTRPRNRAPPLLAEGPQRRSKGRESPPKAYEREVSHGRAMETLPGGSQGRLPQRESPPPQGHGSFGAGYRACQSGPAGSKRRCPRDGLERNEHRTGSHRARHRHGMGFHDSRLGRRAAWPDIRSSTPRHARRDQQCCWATRGVDPRAADEPHGDDQQGCRPGGHSGTPACCRSPSFPVTGNPSQSRSLYALIAVDNIAYHIPSGDTRREEDLAHSPWTTRSRASTPDDIRGSPSQGHQGSYQCPLTGCECQSPWGQPCRQASGQTYSYGTIRSASSCRASGRSTWPARPDSPYRADRSRACHRSHKEADCSRACGKRGPLPAPCAPSCRDSRRRCRPHVTRLRGAEPTSVGAASPYLTPMLARPEVLETGLGQSLVPQFLFGIWALGCVEWTPLLGMPTSHPVSVGRCRSVAPGSFAGEGRLPGAWAVLSLCLHPFQVYLCPPWSLVWLWASSTSNFAAVRSDLGQCCRFFCQFPGARNTCIGRSGARALGTGFQVSQACRLQPAQTLLEVEKIFHTVRTSRALNTCIGSSGARALMTEPSLPRPEASTLRTGRRVNAGVYLAIWRLCAAWVYLCASYGISVCLTPPAEGQTLRKLQKARVQCDEALQLLTALPTCPAGLTFQVLLVCPTFGHAAGCTVTWIEQQAQSTGCILAGIALWALFSLLLERFISPRPKPDTISMRSWRCLCQHSFSHALRKPSPHQRPRTRQRATANPSDGHSSTPIRQRCQTSRGLGKLWPSLFCWVFGFCHLPCVVAAPHFGATTAGIILCTSVDPVVGMTAPDRSFWAASPTGRYRMDGWPPFATI